MSQPLIIGAVSLAVIDTTVTDLRKSTSRGPSFRIVLGGFIVMVGLLAFSDVNEDIADGLAILILLTTLFGPNGGALATVITGATTTGYTPPPSIFPMPTTPVAYQVWTSGTIPGSPVNQPAVGGGSSPPLHT